MMSMIRRAIETLHILIGKEQKAQTPQENPYRIQNIYDIENDTIRYKLAQESLIVADIQPSKYYTRFTDNGDLTLSTLYEDYCRVYAGDIRKEENTNLRVLDY